MKVSQENVLTVLLVLESMNILDRQAPTAAQLHDELVKNADWELSLRCVYFALNELRASGHVAKCDWIKKGPMGRPARPYCITLSHMAEMGYGSREKWDMAELRINGRITRTCSMGRDK